MDQRFSFFSDVPDLSAFVFPDGAPEDIGEEVKPPTSRVQIAKAGRFKHPRYGKFAITAATFDKFVANFDAGIPTDQLPVDFDHEPEMGGKTCACGWIKKLEPAADTLFAHVEWNWDGAFAIREKRYRYVSPTWSLNWVDEEGTTRGPTMLAFGLTNRPYFTMPAVSLSATFSREELEDGAELAVEDHTPPVVPDERLFDRAYTRALNERRVTAAQRDSLHALFAQEPGLALETLGHLNGVG